MPALPRVLFVVFLGFVFSSPGSAAQTTRPVRKPTTAVKVASDRTPPARFAEVLGSFANSGK